jgi:O-antigen/teichoic acid export membrane protein
MLPIYTRYLSPADYGLLELLSMVIDFVSLIFGMQVGHAIYRYYANYEDLKDKHEVISTSMLLILGSSFVGMLLIQLLSKPLSGLVFGNLEHIRLLMLFSFTLVLNGMTMIPLLFIRAIQRPWIFLAFSMAKLCLQLSLNIYFVVGLGMKAEGVVYSALISGMIMSVALSWYTFSITGIRWASTKAMEIVRFSFPLIWSGLLSFFLTFGDRYFLRLFSGVDAVGVYSLAYRFGFLLHFVIVGPFGNIWSSEMYHVAKRKNGIVTIQKVFLVFSAVLVTCALGLSLFVSELLIVMSDPQFWPAARIVPVILAAYVLQGWSWYVGFGVLVKERPVVRTYANIAAVVVILPGYLVLIPQFGAMGAAWATLVAFTARFSFLHWQTKKIYDMRLPWGRVIPLAGIALGTVVISLAGPQGFWPALALDTALFCSYCVLFFMLPILPPDTRQMLLANILRPKRILAHLKS